ncbi:MAG: hypothetical protein KC503_20660 [Myxococcales bacterium]|nr:hypothetical protein [Myxococcales bacterium]
MTRRVLLLLLLPLCLTACGSTGSPLPSRVAVAPLRRVAVSAERANAVRETISRELRRVPVPLSARDAVDREGKRCDLSSDDAAKRVACATDLGKRVGASHVIVGGIGGLGRISVVQLSLVGVREAAVTRALEETVFERNGRDRALRSITRRLLDIPPRLPWYRRWWVWTIVGVAVTAAVVLPLALRRDDPFTTVEVP